MHQCIIGILLIAILTDLSTVLVNGLQHLNVASLDSRTEVDCRLALLNMARQVLDVHLQLAVGTFGDILDTVYQVQVYVLPVDLLRTILTLLVIPLPVLALYHGTIGTFRDECLFGLRSCGGDLDLGVLDLVFQP